MIKIAIGMITILTAILLSGWSVSAFGSDIGELVIRETKPLKFPRGNRLPLYVWSAMDVGTRDNAETERRIRELNDRGIGAICTWSYSNKEKSLSEGLRIASIQKKLGLEVNINANPCMHQFFNGDERTAHITDSGERFFDFSFSRGVRIGCPFSVKFRYPAIREQIEYFARAYSEKGLKVDFIFADWEIDGPIEWNGAWENSKKCKRCRENIKNIDDFTEFQKALRTIRCEMQREVFSDTMRNYFPDVLVGNYGVYPNDGYRYWYDYYEEFTGGAPYKADQRAKYRQWFQEFPLTGYTIAMPVVYTWYGIFNWYDFKNPDYRWFYNLLLNATNACKSTLPGIPIISFVHWHTTSPPDNPDPDVRQFSKEKYQELLWHMLLRGTDTFFLWCPEDETAEEVRLVHEVYAASLEYKGTAR